MIEQKEIDKMKLTPIEEVAERLGLDVSRHKCHCPFHDDSRPSLTFNTYKNRYRCYVCDAHGGVIDLVMHVKRCDFKEAVRWLGGTERMEPPMGISQIVSAANKQNVYPLDLEWLSTLVRVKVLNEPARRFLFDERKIDPRVVQWCGLTSISQDTPCWKFGKPFYDAPALLIPYYDIDGRIQSVQGRYLGKPSTAPSKDVPRFRFPRGSNCHVYNLQILKMLAPGEPLFITEGCSDCWAMLSAGHKAIAIPSATLLKDKDIEPLKGLNLHIFPDQDAPGEKLFLELKDRLPQLVRHQLPTDCKDFGEYWKSISMGKKVNG